MNRFALSHAVVTDPQQQRNNTDLLNGLNALGTFVTWGDGNPTTSPDAPQLYLKRDGGVGDSVWAWDTATWTAIA